LALVAPLPRAAAFFGLDTPPLACPSPKKATPSGKEQSIRALFSTHAWHSIGRHCQASSAVHYGAYTVHRRMAAPVVLPFGLRTVSRPLVKPPSIPTAGPASYPPGVLCGALPVRLSQQPTLTYKPRAQTFEVPSPPPAAQPNPAPPSCSSPDQARRQALFTPTLVPGHALTPKPTPLPTPKPTSSRQRGLGCALRAVPPGFTGQPTHLPMTGAALPTYFPIPVLMSEPNDVPPSLYSAFEPTRMPSPPPYCSRPASPRTSR
jgi:hypothetical protein